MSEQSSPFTNTVDWLQAGIDPSEVVTRLKASGMGAREIALLLTAAARQASASGSQST